MRKKLCKIFFMLSLMFSILILKGITASATENAMFPMEYLNISQGVNNSYSHQGRLAIDICGKDTGIDAFPAPFTGTVKKTYGSDHVVWFESNEPVRFADGSIDYMTIMCMHDNDISDLWVGKVIAQGQPFLAEGTAGNATGNHIHLECGRGRFSGSGWYENSYGKWCINNGINPWDALMLADSKVLFLGKPTIIYNGYGYNWRYASAYTHTTPPSSPILRGYQSEVAAGQPYLFEYSVNNAERMYIAIDVNGVREHFIEVSGDHYNGIFTKPGRYEAYLYAVNSAGDSGLSNCVGFDVYNCPPQNSTISINNNLFHSGASITFSFNAKYATEFQVAIYCNGDRIITTDRISKKEYTTQLTTVGHYYAYVSAYNPFGYYDSWPVEFDTYDTLPTSSWLKIDKTSVMANEEVTFTCGAKNATRYTIEINKDGKRICTEDIKTIHKMTFSESGSYTAYISAFNYYGYVDSEKISFEVHNPKPIISSTLDINDYYYLIDAVVSNPVPNAISTVAIYDNNGILLSLIRNELPANGEIGVSFSRDYDVSYAKIFLWDEDMQPLTTADTIPVK